jgi:hypothetical protein
MRALQIACGSVSTLFSPVFATSQDQLRELSTGKGAFIVVIAASCVQPLQSAKVADRHHQEGPWLMHYFSSTEKN